MTEKLMRVRLPPDLRRQVEKAARVGHRSMNQEIIDRLERSFALEKNVINRAKDAAWFLRVESDGTDPVADLRREVELLREEVAAMKLGRG